MSFRLLIQFSICTSILFAHGHIKADILPTGKDDGFCSVEEEYHARIGSSEIAAKHSLAPLDNSCFIDPKSIRIKDFLVLDARSKSARQHSSFQFAAPLSEHLLLNSSQYKPYSLLILTHGLARTESAQLCSRLKSKGFAKAYLVQGGTKALSLQHFTHSKANLQLLSKVSAQDILRWSQSNKLIVYANPQEAYSVRESLGTDTTVATSSFDDQNLLQQLGEPVKTPVVLIVPENYDLSDDVKRMAGVYWLDGGVKKLKEAKALFNVSKQKRAQVPDRYRCKA